MMEAGLFEWPLDATYVEDFIAEPTPEKALLLKTVWPRPSRPLEHERKVDVKGKQTSNRKTDNNKDDKVDTGEVETGEKDDWERQAGGNFLPRTGNISVVRVGRHPCVVVTML
jgi:hypothetical protein